MTQSSPPYPRRRRARMEDNGRAPASCEPSVAEDGRRPCSGTGQGGLDLSLQVHGSERHHMDCSFDFVFS
jgi:hypothetical protein